MPSLLLFVFTLQLAIHLVNTIDAGAINNLLWIIYNKLPTPTSVSVSRQTELRREIVRLNREMNSTSSQDEFAKWAKLRRQHDKTLAEYDQTTQSLQAFKTSFDSTISILRWLGTNGLRMFMQFWFSKQPMFWLPRGWVPSYIEWILAFPRASTGSISIQVWAVACASVIQIVSVAIVAGWALVTEQKSGNIGRGEPMKMEGRGSPGPGTSSEAGKREKKEL